MGKYIHEVHSKTCDSPKKAIRAMNKASYNESSSPLFAKSRVLKFQDLQNLQICRLMYDTVHGYLPDSVTSLFDSLGKNPGSAPAMLTFLLY